VDVTVIAVNYMHSKQSAIPTSGWTTKKGAAIIPCVEFIYKPSELCQAAGRQQFSTHILRLLIICAIFSWV